MNHNSNDWALCQDYRHHVEAYAAKMRLAQSVQSNGSVARTRQNLWTMFQEYQQEQKTKLTIVPLKRAYTY